MNRTIIIIAACLTCVACAPKATQATEQEEATDSIAQVQEPEPLPFPTKVAEIPVPEGYARMVIDDTTSFAWYLRHLPLKPKGTPVLCYDGVESQFSDIAYAVIDGIDVGNEDIQQCADAIIRLRAEWLYKHKRYSDIAFHFTNGWLCDYTHWAEGNRVAVNGNRTSWYKGAERDYSYPTFRQYLRIVFYYAGTLSLSRELRPVEMKDIQIGDVFITGGSPGHAILVIDVAENPATNDRYFIVAQSYMPAQDIHILPNYYTESELPWYSVHGFIERNWCDFPSYNYSINCLKRFE